MIKPSSYVIKFNNGKQNIVIPENSVNAIDSPLTLFGRNSENWAKHINENFIHILENFNNEYYPGYSNQLLDGQLWFDNDTNKLKLCTDRNTRVWNVLCNADSPELKNIATVDNIENYLNDYILLDGNDTPMYHSLKLIHIDANSNNQVLATKRYVEEKSGKCGKIPDSKSGVYVPMIGESNVSTKVFLQKVIPTDENSCANVNYINNISKISNEIKYFDINNSLTVLETANYTQHIMESGKDTMMYINGSIIFNKYETVKELSWSPPYTDNYYCTLSGGMHNVDSGNASSDIIDDIYFEKTSTDKITIHRKTNDKDEVVYFSMCGLFGMVLPTTTTTTTAAPTTQPPATTAAPTTAAPVSTTTQPGTTTTQPGTTTTTTATPTTTTTTVANAPGYIGEDDHYKYYISPKSSEKSAYWSIPSNSIKGASGVGGLSGSGATYTASSTDGYANTKAVAGLSYANKVSMQYPAFSAFGSLQGGVGYTQKDWYLPSINELTMIKKMKDTLTPAYEVDDSAAYWSSTESPSSGTSALTYSFSDGQSNAPKSTTKLSRAIRRVPK
jgi:hypothetical protein